MASVPELAKHEGSWVVVHKGTVKAVFETFSRVRAAAIDGEKYDVLTIGDYLGRVSKEVSKS